MRFQGRVDLPIPFIKVSDMNSPGNEKHIVSATNYVDEKLLKAMNARTFPPGSLVFPKVGAALLTNKRRILTRPTAIDNNIMVLIPESVESDFLYYRTLQIDMGEYVQRGALPSVNQATIRQIHILLPPLPEQKKIAAILGSVDEAIQATQAVIDQTRKVKQGLLQQLLTRGIGHTRFKKTEIGEIPEEWEVATARECVERGFILALQDGNHGSQYPRKSEFVREGLRYLSASNITEDGDIDFANCPCLAQDTSRRLRIPPAQGGDVILTHNATVGRVALLPKDAGVVIASTSTTYYRANARLLAPEYLVQYFRSRVYQRQLQRIMGQTTRNQVPITAQRNLSIVMPPLDEQKRITNLMAAVDEPVTAGRHKLATLINTKMGLMQDLLTGRVRVKGAA